MEMACKKKLRAVVFWEIACLLINSFSAKVIKAFPAEKTWVGFEVAFP